jgi:hypothetical protein
MQRGQHLLRMKKREPLGDHRAAMAVARRAEIACRILADEQEVGCVGAVAHRERAAGAVGRLSGERGLRSEGDIREVKPVTAPKSCTVARPRLVPATLRIRAR